MDYSIDIDIDDILWSCSKQEKKELLEALLQDKDLKDVPAAKNAQQEEVRKERMAVTEYLEALPPYELKRVLCDVLNVPTYVDDNLLQQALDKLVSNG